MTTTNSSLHDAPQISAKPAPGEKERCVLAYSGGLDTSVCIKWLQEEYDLDVIAARGRRRPGARGPRGHQGRRRSRTGAIDCAGRRHARGRSPTSTSPCAIAANAMYENKYPLLSALVAARSSPSTSWTVAHQFGAKYVAHGCTGKGNDQVRFESSRRSMLDPALTIIAPVREWDLELPARRKSEWARGPRRARCGHHQRSPYSIDDNLWGRAIECGVLEDPWSEPPADICTMTCDPA